jgi:hypothetical protein
MLSVRPVTPDDVSETGLRLPPEWSIGEPVGYVAERNGAVAAIAQVTWDQWGRAWAWYDAFERLPAATVYRRSLEMLRMLREVKEPALYVICDLSISGSVKLLKRLGFVLDETIKSELGPVYRCDIKMNDRCATCKFFDFREPDLKVHGFGLCRVDHGSMDLAYGWPVMPPDGGCERHETRCDLT